MATRKPKTQRKVSAKRQASDAVLGSQAEAQVSPAVAPSEEQIRQRAYELYQQRGGNHGEDWHDWFAAERELIGEHATG